MAPPTSKTRQSPATSAKSSAALRTAPGVGRIPCRVRVAEPRHSRRVDDVAVEGLVDEAAERLDVEDVDVGEDVLGDVELDARRAEELFDGLSERGVARVEDGHGEAAPGEARSGGGARETRELLGVPEDDPLLAEIDTAREEDEVRADLADLVQLEVVELPRRHHLHDAAGTEGRLARRARRHRERQAVDGHPEAPGRRAVDERLGPGRVEAGGAAKVLERRVDTDPDVPRGDARRGEALGHVVEAAAGETHEAVRLRDRRADLQRQDLDPAHRSERPRASPPGSLFRRRPAPGAP